ncbi:hypothetical protein GQ55_4G250600 [Panicum hallii var. hallii]|uniref:Uncharacterized protein n=1 Tax=Panicum hallii var. hallii TaxID=1504633 RepID=A0A2T7E008_9POAL|nr:hypothetical protein GQ55_4G250600 [Panicum hallii var. hallii]
MLWVPGVRFILLISSQKHQSSSYLPLSRPFARVRPATTRRLRTALAAAPHHRSHQSLRPLAGRPLRPRTRRVREFPSLAHGCCGRDRSLLHPLLGSWLASAPPLAHGCPRAAARFRPAARRRRRRQPSTGRAIRLTTPEPLTASSPVPDPARPAPPRPCSDSPFRRLAQETALVGLAAWNRVLSRVVGCGHLNRRVPTPIEQTDTITSILASSRIHSTAPRRPPSARAPTPTNSVATGLRPRNPTALNVHRSESDTVTTTSGMWGGEGRGGGTEGS